MSLSAIVVYVVVVIRKLKGRFLQRDIHAESAVLKIFFVCEKNTSGVWRPSCSSFVLVALIALG